MSTRSRALTIGGIALLVTVNLVIGIVFVLSRPNDAATMVMPAQPMAMSGRTMSASSCTLVSTTQLAAAVGRIVESPAPRSNPRETICVYRISSSPQRVRITYSMFVSPRGFARWASDVTATGHLARHLCGLGDSAYVATVPSRHGSVTAVTMLVGSTQVLIEAPVSATQVTALAHTLAPAI